MSGAATEQEDREQARSGGLLGAGRATLTVFVLFGYALAVSVLVARAAETVIEVGSPGTVSSLLVSVAGLQVLGFAVAALALLGSRDLDPQQYLRLDGITEWDVFYGTAVGLGMMLVAVGATVVFNLLGLEPARSAAGSSRNPAFYVFLFALSTFVAVPLEELFFRGIVQRRLEESVHPGVAVAVASVLFTAIHTNVVVEAGGEFISFGMFFSFGVVLGSSYYLTQNLYVPLIGHVFFNGIQILVRAVEVAV